MRRKLSKWHRRIGLISLVLLTWLAVTGVLLNHAHSLGLDRPIGSARIAQIYGVEANCAEQGWLLEQQSLVDCKQTLLLSGKPLDQISGPVRGALHWNGLLFVATGQGMLLLTPRAERVEWLDKDLLPGIPLRLGHTAQRLVLQTPAGRFASDADLVQWQSLAPDEKVYWSGTQLLSTEDLNQARSLAAAQQLSWTKLVQDLHSGRIIGLPGSLLADLGALSIVVLAILGLVMSQSTATRRPHRPAGAPTAAKPDDKPSA